MVDERHMIIDIAVKAAMKILKDATGDMVDIVIIASYENPEQKIKFASMSTSLCCPSCTAQFLLNCAEEIANGLEQRDAKKRAIN